MPKNKAQVVGYGRGHVAANVGEVMEILARAGVAPERVLTPAALKAAQIVVDEAAQRAPGPHIVAQVNKRAAKRGELMVEIGPDAEHFYYKFHETGVQPFEINLVTGKSKRSSGKRRKVRGAGKKALHWGNIFAKRVQRGGMAAQPFLRPALESKRDEASGVMGREFMSAIMAVAMSG